MNFESILFGLIFGLIALLFFLLIMSIPEHLEWRRFSKRMERKNKEWNEKIADAFVKELMKDEKVLAMLKEHAKKIKEENNDKRTND
jgi:hypothetical protein